MNSATKIRLLSLALFIILTGAIVYVASITYGPEFGWVTTKEKLTLWMSVMALLIILLGLLSFGISAHQKTLHFSSLKGKNKKAEPVGKSKSGAFYHDLNAYLHSRYHLLWRYKVRLLLVVGDDAARAALVPGLQEQQWLEGQRTVLIDGGSLSAAPDAEKLAALRQLRRGRPLDGIVWVLADGQLMTPQMQDNGLRSLENISQALRWQPPVWLWQLRGSEWPQDGREQQTVGALFSARARPEEVSQQLDSLVPQLREQGMAQIAQHLSHDFLLRLGSELEQGESLQWQPRLANGQLSGTTGSVSAPMYTHRRSHTDPAKATPRCHRRSL